MGIKESIKNFFKESEQEESETKKRSEEFKKIEEWRKGADLVHQIILPKNKKISVEEVSKEFMSELSITGLKPTRKKDCIQYNFGQKLSGFSGKTSFEINEDTILVRTKTSYALINVGTVLLGFAGGLGAKASAEGNSNNQQNLNEEVTKILENISKRNGWKLSIKYSYGKTY